MNRIIKIMKLAREKKKKVFIPYITAGDPDLDFTKEAVKILVDSGASLIELGVPFSDPMADGETNQYSAERALKSGTSLDKIIKLVANLRSEDIKVPIILFTYYNPLLKIGIDNFAIKAKRAGIDGVLIVDLPFERSIEVQDTFEKHSILQIHLASMTTSQDRLKKIDKNTKGFIYYISKKGVTGAGQVDFQSVSEEIHKIQHHVKNPIVVGFGITSRKQAETICKQSDGFVIGSKIMNLIHQNHFSPKRVRELVPKNVLEAGLIDI